MPPYVWNTYYLDAAQTLEHRRSIGKFTPRLVVWVGFSVDALHYLADLDDYVVTNRAPLADH